jgi:hypothetical protein
MSFVQGHSPIWANGPNPFGVVPGSDHDPVAPRAERRVPEFITVPFKHGDPPKAFGIPNPCGTRRHNTSCVRTEHSAPNLTRMPLEYSDLFEGFGVPPLRQNEGAIQISACEVG